MNFSKQREIIYNHVKCFPTHPTAEQVHTALKKDYPNLSLGTVYRNLNLLSELGMLKRIHIADGSDRFDGRTDPHFHMICENCGRVYDVDLDSPDELIKLIKERDGHEITGIMLNLKGTCSECIKATDAES